MWLNDRYIPNYLMVAASDAPTEVQAAAGYRCAGSNDQEMIQRALDEVGCIVLPKGSYWVQGHSTSVEVSGTGNLTAGSGAYTEYCNLDVGANHSLFAPSDVVYIYGGTPTLESKYAEGPYLVTAVTGADLEATEIQLAINLNTTFTGVSYVRPKWAINLKPGCSITGAGKMMSIIKQSDNANCSGIWFSAPLISEGAQNISHLSYWGRAASQNGDKWLNNGVLAAAYDPYILHSEIRYCKGYGVVGAQGWGLSMADGWIEDCDVGLFCNTGFFQKVKILQNPTAAVILTLNTLGGPHFVDCEMGSYGNSTRCFLNRGRGTPVITGGVMQVHGGTGNAIYEALGCDGYYPIAPVMDGVRFKLAADSLLLKLASSAIHGGRISGALGHSALPATLIDNPHYWIGANLDLGGANYTLAPAGALMKSVAVLNATGGAFTAGYSYAWKTGSGTTADQVVAVTAGTLHLFAGVAPQLGVADATRGYLNCRGLCKAYVDADAGAIIIGDLLSLSTATLGAMKKAASTETMLARAREAKASGKAAILVDLVDQPRVLP